jgi:hypothetical protein
MVLCRGTQIRTWWSGGGDRVYEPGGVPYGLDV